MTSLPVDIVMLPSEELTQKAVAASKSLQQHGALFELNAATGPFPHASLYMTQLKTEDLDKAKEIIAGIAAKTPVFNLVATRYVQEEGYIDPDYERTDELADLQMKVVNAINPIRDGMRAKDIARLPETTGIVRENLEKYGYRGVGELFRPHMTLARFAVGKKIDTSVLPPASELSGQFIKLGLFEMGDNGTCVRKIAEFELGGAV
ncbi:MAG: DUF1045 domain-containing protein [Candidatus Woesebacteria bacterium]|jgi:hypothetical protein